MTPDQEARAGELAGDLAASYLADADRVAKINSLVRVRAGLMGAPLGDWEAAVVTGQVLRDIALMHVRAFITEIDQLDVSHLLLEDTE